MLLEFKKQGGTIIFTEEIPEYINGIKSSSLLKLAKDCKVADSKEIAQHVPEDCRLLSVDAEEKNQKHFICATTRHFRKQNMTMYGGTLVSINQEGVTSVQHEYVDVSEFL